MRDQNPRSGNSVTRLLSVWPGKGVKLFVFWHVLVEARRLVVARLRLVKEGLALVSEEEDVVGQRVKGQAPDESRNKQVHVDRRFVLEAQFLLLAKTVIRELLDQHIPFRAD